jgi:hypothetical protein
MAKLQLIAHDDNLKNKSADNKYLGRTSVLHPSNIIQRELDIKIENNPKYKVIKGYSVNALEKQVNELMSHGWQPQGGMIVSGMLYAQAIVKV